MHPGRDLAGILRRDARLGITPILLNRSFGEAIDALSDGVASSSVSAAECAAAIAARAATLGRRETAEGTSDCWPSFILAADGSDTGCRLARRAHLSLPLADALSPSGEDGFLMLDRMRRRGCWRRPS